MENARADDSGTLKPRILLWTAQDPSVTTTIAVASTSKALRGFFDPLIAPLLLPLEFKDDPKYPKYTFVMRIPSTSLTLLQPPGDDREGGPRHYRQPAPMLPVPLRPSQRPLRTRHDSQRAHTAPSEFFFLPVNTPLTCTCQGAKGLLMGPSSALQGDGWHQGKPGNAALIGLKTFTDRVICYNACQVSPLRSSWHRS